MPKLQQVKLEDNRLTRAIPPEFASLADLRVLWLEDNNFEGSIPAAFGARNALRRVISVNFEDNPVMCGDVPEGLVVDWRWHLENQAGQSRDWLAFCEKDPCGVFAYGGTGIGRPCPSGEAAAATCGKAWEQCGGTVALRLTGDADWSADATRRRLCGRPVRWTPVLSPRVHVRGRSSRGTVRERRRRMLLSADASPLPITARDPPPPPKSPPTSSPRIAPPTARPTPTLTPTSHPVRCPGVSAEVRLVGSALRAAPGTRPAFARVITFRSAILRSARVRGRHAAVRVTTVRRVAARGSV